MSKGVYELIALGARYVFTALMLLIVVRACRLTVTDASRAGKLRHMSPDTGLIGELLVLNGDERARRGMRYPVTLEGMLGSSRRADIRIRHSSVRKKHAYFELTGDGLKLTAIGGAPLRKRGRTGSAMLLRDGDEFDVGRVRLQLVLSTLQDAPRRAGHFTDDRDIDRMFEENPVLNHRLRDDDPDEIDEIDFFDD